MVHCLPDHFNARVPWRVVVWVYDRHPGLDPEDALVASRDATMKVFEKEQARQHWTDVEVTALVQERKDLARYCSMCFM